MPGRVREEAIHLVQKTLGARYRAFWKRRAFFRWHCGVRMAVLTVRVPRDGEVDESSVLVCMESECNFTEPDMKSFD